MHIYVSKAMMTEWFFNKVVCKQDSVIGDFYGLKNYTQENIFCYSLNDTTWYIELKIST